MPILAGQWMTAGAAEFRITFDQPVADGNAFVENEALAFPEAFFGPHLFEIFQDATLEMVDSSSPSDRT